VIDNGRGFEEAEQERVFEMFGRGDNVGDTPGTGIGLAMCKRIVEAHGGRIWAKSEPRRGAQFIFVLPEAGTGGEAPLKLEQ
jgi:signal transduction histidine kinase